MISILVLTHEDFGAGMLKSASLIVGELKNCLSLGLNRGDDITAFGRKVQQEIEKIDAGNGVLVFVDLFGASPYNVMAIASAQIKNKFRCISGVSFPMLLEALTMRETYGLDQLTEHCMEVGAEAIKELFTEIERM